MYRLYFLSGKFRGKRLTIQTGSILAGRDAACQLCLDDDERAAPRHASIEYRGGGPVIRALDGSHPLIVNQQQVQEHRLRHGDRIEIGGTIIEFQSGAANATPRRQHHRFSKMQAVSFLAIGLIILLQVAFVVLFPIWQKRETVPVVIPPKAEESVAQATGATGTVATAPAEVMTGQPDKSPVEVASPGEVKEVEVAEAPPPPSPQAPPPEKPPELPDLPELMVERPPQINRDLPEDPMLDQAREMHAEARQLVSAGDYVEADNLLHRVQMLAPDYVPAARERAMLYEKRGLKREAAHQWRKVMDLTDGTPEHEKAAAEHRRLTGAAQQQQALREPVPAREPPAAAEAAPSRRIRIVSVERERFKAGEDYDEMRLLRITLRPQTVEGAVASDRIEAVVRFYDRVESTGKIVPTRVMTPGDGLKVSGPWPAGEARKVTASYVVPKGYRAKEYTQLRERRNYEGYRVALYYQGELQDESAMPRSLLEMGPPPPPSSPR